MKFEIHEKVFFPLTKEEVKITAYSQSSEGKTYYKALFPDGKEKWWEEKHYSEIKRNG
jgi:hypothetical protein